MRRWSDHISMKLYGSDHRWKFVCAYNIVWAGYAWTRFKRYLNSAYLTFFTVFIEHKRGAHVDDIRDTLVRTPLNSRGTYAVVCYCPVQRCFLCSNSKVVMPLYFPSCTPQQIISRAALSNAQSVIIIPPSSPVSLPAPPLPFFPDPCKGWPRWQ